MKTTIIICTIIISSMVQAQQDASFSMYFFNPMYINPGYAGSRETFSGTIVNRNQWANMPDAPNTQSINLHSAIPFSNVGLGLQVYNDRTGPMRNTGINLTYAYHIPVTKNAKLSLGVTGMLNNLNIKWDRIHVENPNDLSFTDNPENSWVPDAAFGMYYYQKRFYAGLSSNHLMESKFGFTDVAGSDKARFFRQYFLTTGIVLPINTAFDIRPSLLIKHVQASPTVFDLNATAIFNKRYYFGLGYRYGDRINMNGSDNMLVALVQFEFSNLLRLAYSYDYYLNQTGKYNSGTHEIMLGWDLSPTKTKMSNPRFF
jgi:type IX secretion system PorP/SprF family membrane protein